MLRQCANSQCGKPFLRLGEGKLFQVEAESAAKEQSDTNAFHLRKQPRRVERYWLCAPCAQLWTLVQDRNHGILLVQMQFPPAGALPLIRVVSREIA
jgi:hypothetical protein